MEFSKALPPSGVISPGEQGCDFTSAEKVTPEEKENNMINPPLPSSADNKIIKIITRFNSQVTVLSQIQNLNSDRVKKKRKGANSSQNIPNMKMKLQNSGLDKYNNLHIHHRIL